MELIVVDHAHEQVVVEVAGAQLGHLAKQQVTHFFQRLALVGIANEHQHRVVGHGVGESTARHHLEGLVQVEVHQTGRAVGEHFTDDVHGVVLQRLGGVKSPAQGNEFSLLTDNRGVDRCGNGCQCREFGTSQVVIGLPTAKVAFQDGDDLIGVKVTRHTDGHVIGAVIIVEVVLDIGD